MSGSKHGTLSGSSEGQLAIKIVSEGPARITKATIEAAWKRRAQRTRLVIRDEECRGLALVVNATSMSWTFSYKPRGVDPISGSRFPTRSVTIGGPATHAPDQARGEANRLKDRAKGGADPAQEKRTKQAADATRRAMTVSRLVNLYALDLPKRPKMRGTGMPSNDYVAAELAHLRAATAAMQADAQPAADLSAANVRGLLKTEAARSAVARHRFGALSRFMDWCVDEGHVPLNICLTIGKDRRPKPAQARSRFLTADQVAGLWKAAGGLSVAVHRDYVRLLLVVPCRRTEAAKMDWGHINLDEAAWSQPGQLTKNNEAHRLHLPELVLNILRARWEAAGKPASGLVFPSPKAGAALTTHSAIKAELDKLAGFSAWSWHDMRRTFATTLEQNPISRAHIRRRRSSWRSPAG